MELILACIYFAILALALQRLTVAVCARHGALWPWRTFLQLASLAWLGMALAKKFYIDEIFPPVDGLEHEAAAREVAELLLVGRFSEAVSGLSGIGNSAYQLLLGVFYALTGAPEVVTYAINGAFGFWGLLLMLEILCRQTNCARLPTAVVFMFSLLPSGLLWTTANLKEGPILWGICAMCYLTVPAEKFRGRPPRVAIVLGLLIVMAMRPHIAIAWLAAIGAGTMIHTRRFRLFFVSAAGAMVSLGLFAILRPQLFEQALSEGPAAMLSNYYDLYSSQEAVGREPIFGNNPIPVLSGLLLILFRPWPTEADGIDAFLAGLEVWCLAAYGLLNWKMSGRAFRLRSQTAMLSYVFLMILMGFLFSYMYNMGLAVRQRLMCAPAVLAIYAWPLLVRYQARSPAVRRPHVRLQTNKRPVVYMPN